MFLTRLLIGFCHSDKREQGLKSHTCFAACDEIRIGMVLVDTDPLTTWLVLEGLWSGCAKDNPVRGGLNKLRARDPCYESTCSNVISAEAMLYNYCCDATQLLYLVCNQLVSREGSQPESPKKDSSPW